MTLTVKHIPFLCSLNVSSVNFQPLDLVTPLLDYRANKLKNPQLKTEAMGGFGQSVSVFGYWHGDGGNHSHGNFHFEEEAIVR